MSFLRAYVILLICLVLTVLQGCDNSNSSSNVIVKIYGYAEYDCTEDKYRLTKATPLIPFLKINKWYTRKQIHEANYQETIKPFKDLPMSTETLKKIAPTLQMSNQFLYELTRGIDCKNPKDLLF